MPSKAAHTQAARENQRAIDYLSEKIDEFPQWVTTIAFYKALHIVEAILAAEGRHCDDHAARNLLLKTTRRFQHIWKHYRPLFNDSLIARYLREDGNSPTYDVFATYLSPGEVRAQVLGHRLRQIEQSARTLLGEPEYLRQGSESARRETRTATDSQGNS